MVHDLHCSVSLRRYYVVSKPINILSSIDIKMVTIIPAEFILVMRSKYKQLLGSQQILY